MRCSIFSAITSSRCAGVAPRGRNNSRYFSNSGPARSEFNFSVTVALARARSLGSPRISSLCLPSPPRSIHAASSG